MPETLAPQIRYNQEIFSDLVSITCEEAHDIHRITYT